MTTGDGVVLSWDTDTHLVVAGSLNGEAASGRDHIGAVQISYEPHVLGMVDDHAPNSYAVTPADVTYSVQQMEAGWNGFAGGPAVCVIRVEGRDDRRHRRVGVGLVGVGVGPGLTPNPEKPFFIPYVLMFDATYLPDAIDQPTLTQAALKGTELLINDRDAVHKPFQAHIKADELKIHGLIRQFLIYSASLGRPQVSTIFDAMRKGRYEAVFEFGLGKQVVTYRFNAPIPRSVAEQYQACEATTPISWPLIGPRLTRALPGTP